MCLYSYGRDTVECEPLLFFFLQENIGTSVDQVLNFKLGELRYIMEKEPKVIRLTNDVVASVCTIQFQKGHIQPAQIASIEEWFDYTFISVLPAIYGGIYKVTNAKPTQRDYKHFVTQLFLLPPVEMVLKTEQKQDISSIDAKNPPELKYYLDANFGGCLRVSHDVEALSFLRDLVNSYQRKFDDDKKASAGGDQTTVSWLLFVSFKQF